MVKADVLKQNIPGSLLAHPFVAFTSAIFFSQAPGPFVFFRRKSLATPAVIVASSSSFPQLSTRLLAFFLVAP